MIRPLRGRIVVEPFHGVPFSHPVLTILSLFDGIPEIKKFCDIDLSAQEYLRTLLNQENE